MSRAVFQPPGVSGDAEWVRVMGTLDQVVCKALMNVGLHNNNVWDTSSAFGVLLLDTLHVVSRDDFLFVEAQFHEDALSSDGCPKVASVKAWLAGLSGDLNWRNTGTVGPLRADTDAVCSRFIRAYKDIFSAQKVSDVDGGEELSGSTGESMDAQWLRNYGYPVDYAGLASLQMCQSFHSQLTKGLKTYDLKKVFRRDKVVQQDDPEIVTNIRTGKTKSRVVDIKKIVGEPDFIERIGVAGRTLAYVSVLHTAPEACWGGPKSVGTVRGVRYQFDMATSLKYEKFWTEMIPLFHGNIGKAIYEEQQLRASLISLKDTDRLSLACAYLQAMNDKRGSIQQAADRLSLDALKRGGPSGRVVPGTGGGGPKQRLDGKFDITKVPGYKADFPGTYKGEFEFNGKKAEFCKFWNDERGCRAGNACTKHHFCDVKLADGNPCCAEHTRRKHQ